MKKEKKRTAVFVCSLSYKDRKGKVVTVEGKLKGNISLKIIGKKGFGYDPIFIPLKKKITFGQMSKLNKIKMDHRFLAFQKLKNIVKTL
jgi:XTP/dITP diphosphohydrolase